MADGLSVAASIAGLFTVAEAVTRKAYQYIKEAKNANKEISKLLSETTELFAILHGLHLVALRFEGEEFDRTIQTHHIHSCYVMLDKLDSKLVDCSPSNYSNPKKVVLKKLAWPFSSSETKEMITELERQKSTLKLALSVDSMLVYLLRNQIYFINHFIP